MMLQVVGTLMIEGEQSKDLFVNELKRTCVHVTPRASLCTTTLMCGSFTPVAVRARKLRGLYETL